MSNSCPPPPPPPPMPGTPGAVKIPSYKDQQELNRQQSPSHNSIQEQQYANLPAKLMTAMNKDKKPFTYTLGGIGEGGILDLSEIKSPRMKKRIQANLRGIEESGNEIKTPPTPDLLTNLDEENSRDKVTSPMTFKLPPPPPKTIQSLENATNYTSPTSPCLSRTLAPFNSQPSSAYSNGLNGSYENAFDEQLSNLCTGLNLKTDFNNNNTNSNMSKLYSFNNYNSSPKPFTPTSSPFTSTPFESVQPKATPVIFNRIHNQSSLDEAIDSGCFPRPPPPQVSLTANAVPTPPAPSSQVTPNAPATMYAPNVQEQWLARKQQQLSPENKSIELMTGKRCAPDSSYDEKMRKIREANDEYLPPNPITAYMPTLQEKWLQRKHEQQALGAVPKGQSVTTNVPQWTPVRGVGEDEETDRSVPVQSRSFKVLQKLTEGMEDELEAFKIEQEKNDARQRQQVKQQQQQQASNNLWPRSASPVRAKSPVVPNPPIAYAPTLQEQWMMRKQQQQQQQQPQQKVNREVTFSPNTYTPSQSSNYFAPAPQYSSQAASLSGNNRTGDIIIPVQIERSDASRSNEQPVSPRYTGASFPSRSFQALRMMTGEEAFPSFPSSNFFTPMESQFISPTGFVGGASGIQGTDF